MKSLSRNQLITIGFVVISLVGLLVYFYPNIRSKTWYYQKQAIYNNYVDEQSNIISKIRNTPWPQVENQTPITKEELPKEYKIFLGAFMKPKISKATFEDKSHGWMIQEESQLQKQCPPFPSNINSDIQLNFRRNFSHLSRYQYSAPNRNIVLIETRLRAFSCEIEVAIKENRKPI